MPVSYAAVAANRGTDVYGYERNAIAPDGQDIVFRGGLMAFKSGRFQQAYSAWRFTAPSNHAPSQYLLAHMYRKGLGVRPNMRAAYAWYARAATQQVAAAEYRIGVAYLRMGRPVDALQWWMKAARGGYRPAQYNVGLINLYGHGVDRNLGVASEWLHRAANYGSARAQFYLGVMYLNGEGVTKDEARARNLLTEAKNNGFVHQGKDYAEILREGVLPMFAE